MWKSRLRWLYDNLRAAIGLALLAFACWQLLNHFFLMDYVLGKGLMPMAGYHLISLAVEVSLVTLIAFFASYGLVLKNRELQQLQQQKDTLVNTLVHDLRQPLTALITGLSSLSVSDNLPDKHTRATVAIAQEAATMLLNMVNDLLDVARLESGASLIHKISVAPADFINPAIRQLEPLAEHEQVSLHTEIPDDIPQIMGDPNRLQRVIYNLVGNAIKYSGGGSVVIKALLTTTHTLRIAVSDNGPGISPADQSRIFDKFARGETGSATSGRTSTGLGLYFCKLIIEAHGGTIGLTSKPGQGTTFTFSLPLG